MNDKNNRPFFTGGDCTQEFHPPYSLKRDYLLWTLAAALVVFSVLEPRKIADYPGLVNWPTIATLLGLMILTKGVEQSGWLHRAGRDVIARMSNQRVLALFLVCGSALLAMLLTNDIALFVAVPLTLELGTLAALPLRRLVIFEALAVNAGAMLTPIGNPQNIFLWRLAGVDFGHFVWHMLPPFMIAMVCLLLLTAWAFPAARIHVEQRAPAPVVQRPLLLTSALLYIPFLILADLQLTAVGLALVVAVCLIGFPRLLRRIDWPLLVVFVLMFIDLGRLAEYPVLAYVNLAERSSLYLAGALSSQLISNVPAAILLSRYSHDWGTIAWAVDVGGFGLFIASLANLIALRLCRQRGMLLAFHAWSLPFFLVVGALVWLWLKFH
ncbi:MAG: anion transporter [Gammaproteobacteria bacterium]|nr:anion transporter [Gammaproteobacteria bacterium]